MLNLRCVVCRTDETQGTMSSDPLVDMVALETSGWRQVLCANLCPSCAAKHEVLLDKADRERAMIEKNVLRLQEEPS